MCGHDGVVRLWDAATGQELCKMYAFFDGTWAVIDSEGRYDAANNGDVRFLRWEIGTETFPVTHWRDRYYDPGLLAKHLGRHDQPLRKLP